MKGKRIPNENLTSNSLLFYPLDPNVARTVERWSIPGYLSELLGKDVQHRAQYNTNNHFLYSMGGGGKHGRKRHGLRKRQANQPVLDREGRVAESQRSDLKPRDMRMTFDEWLEKANTTTPVGPEDEHYYFRLIGCGYMGTTGDCDKGSSE